MTCITPDCKSSAAPEHMVKGTGLCMKCYTTAKRLVEAGVTTWKDLEDSGLVLVKGGAFMAAFEASRAPKEAK